ncbi:MAG: GvpL/GvpF family gas vesicle protein [Candidatus Brocadiia bacterium]
MIAEQEAAGRYIYAIVKDDEDTAWKADHGFPWAAEPIGFDGCPAYAISVGRTVAVVSDVPNRPLRPERKNLATHYAVLKRLMSQSAVLPMGFGTIADSAESILRILKTHQEALLQQLRRVENKFEMGLRVTLNVPNIFEHFVSTHPELRELRDKMFRPGADPSSREKIELGQLFDRLLSAERAERTRSVVGALSPAYHEIKENAVRDEREVMNLACLVARDAQAAFEQSVFNAAREFDDAYTFDISGPFPPHNFVDLDLRVEEVRSGSATCS